MERKYTLADINILIRTDFDFSDTDRYEPFRSDFEKPDLTYEFITVEKLPPIPESPLFFDGMISIARENNVTHRFYTLSKNKARALLTDERISEGIFTVYVAQEHLASMQTELRVFDHLAIEHAMALFKGTLLHSSFISYDGKAILFTAPSQTGKSTQAELWRRLRGAEVINGDRSLLKIENGVLTAFSLPYCGTSGICLNYSAPVQAIVVLRQAPFNRITPLRPAAAFRDLYEGCATNIWYSDDSKTICDIIEHAITAVPVLLLECLPDGGAVEALANALGI